MRVFKAKYFPSLSFLKAKLGANPNYVRKSIYETQSAIARCARIHIGNGENTSVWRSPWLDKENGGLPYTPNPVNLINARVTSLFEVGGRVWDVGLVRDVSEGRDAVRILNIHLSNMNVEYGWKWILNSKEKFSIRNVYRAVCGEYLVQPNPLWNQIWSFNIPLHVRNFLWRVYLLTLDVLATRKVFIKGQCVVCDNGNETAMHLFYHCLLPKLVGRSWSLVLKDEKCSLISSICSFIWGDGRQQWIPSGSAWVKANVDTTMFANSGGVGLGIVVRDEEGRVIRARQVRLNGNYSPRTAEALGIREVLSWVKDVDKLIVESDAMEVVVEIRNQSLVASKFIVEDCANLTNQFSNILFLFVRRYVNQAAHVLA
ncbi:uncharacterized protein LOC126673095 [Mercurialis annua]|uniref:uncharacterized protein LOC126673095 n=1 Tax=Mercurialis annua TaxID=3986 RepID=UPI0021610851|nr:uncharacterized protein LOC126673095 [Mercurialis annua]